MDQRGPSAENTQAHPRMNVELRARVSSIDPQRDPSSDRPYFSVRDEECTNLSRGGALIVTREPMELGRRVLVELDFPGSGSFQAVGRVAWSRVMHLGPDQPTRSGTGIEFTGASRQHISTLERFLANHKPRPSRSPSTAQPV